MSLDKSEGVVKTEISWAVRDRRRSVPARDFLGGVPCPANQFADVLAGRTPIAGSYLAFDIILERFGEGAV